MQEVNSVSQPSSESVVSTKENPSDDDLEEDKDNETQVSGRSADAAQWKQLYIDFLQSKFKSDPKGYIELADVTENGIPVLLYVQGDPREFMGAYSFEAFTISNDAVVHLVQGGFVMEFVRNKATSEIHGVYKNPRGIYTNANVWSPNPNGALPWKETYRIDADDRDVPNSYYIQDDMRHKFASEDEIIKYLDEGFSKIPASATFSDNEYYELLQFPGENFSSAENWQQAESVISAFFDEYDGYADHIKAGGNTPTESKMVRIDADGGLRMRVGPGTDYDIIKVIPQNALVELATGEKDNPDWLYVSYAGDLGWVTKEYISYDLEPAKAESTNWRRFIMIICQHINIPHGMTIILLLNFGVLHIASRRIKPHFLVFISKILIKTDFLNCA